MKHERSNRIGKVEDWTQAAIDAGNFKDYQIAIMHDWLRTLTLMASMLVPLFFVLDLFMMPASLLPRFALYRGISTALALLQMLVVRRTRPSARSYLHGYLMTLQIGIMIALMTGDLGGFSSSYYAGLNLVVIGVNLLMPWGAGHTAANALLTIGLYVAVNVVAGLPVDRAATLNNLFFLFATAVLASAINFVRLRLVRREFGLLVDLGKTRDELIGEKGLVEERDRSLKSLLDLSGQGFLTFNSDFVVQPEYSKECESILGGGIAGRRIDEMLYPDPGNRQQFSDGLQLYFTGRSKPEVIFDLLDHELGIGDKAVKIEYRAVSEGSVMTVLTDVTEERRLREASRRENEKWNLLLKVISNKSVFASMDREAENLLDELKSERDGYENLVRNLHTFKADAGFLGFVKTQGAAHRLEDYISDGIALGQALAPAERSSELRQAYEEERGVVSGTLGGDWATDLHTIELPKSDLMMIESHIRMNCPDQPILETIGELRRKPLSEMLGRYPQMVADLAGRMGKRIEPVALVGADGISVVADDFEELVGTFSHIIRNMVDHGIEPPRDREALGKSPTGKIDISVAETEGEIVFTFSDDGRGINVPEVRRRAEELGLVGKDADIESSELVAYIFNDGFSTSTTVNQISGRGVGLSAVREAVQMMGGRIRVQTTKDIGTIFAVAVPARR